VTDDPEFVAAGDHVREELVRFVRSLRRAGAAVPANAATTAARALVAVGFDDRDRVRAALRASLVADREDLDTFDRLFAEFWRRLAAGLDGDGPAPRLADESDANVAPTDGQERGAVPQADSDGDAGGSESGPSVLESFGVLAGDGQRNAGEEVETGLYRPVGGRTRVTGSVGDGSDDLDAAFRELTVALAGLRGRRYRRGGDRPDVRRALRASLGTGGAVLSVPGRERRPSAVRALLLVDVSRSVLETVDRGFLLEFLRRARREWRDARVFFFDEDLREVTDAFDAPTATAASAALETAEAEWGGGTRIGESLAELRSVAPDAADRRTVTVVVSDGLETGDVSDLERELARLARQVDAVDRDQFVEALRQAMGLQYRHQ
jgi:uncharacterized protein with von Willebrand factor type A (vWA) domain